MKKNILALFACALMAFAFTGCITEIANGRTAPGAVSELNAVCQDGKIIITWLDPQDKDLLGVKIYNAQEMDRGAATFEDGILVGKGVERYETSNLEDGKTYVFSVTAIDRSLNESSCRQSQAVTFVAQQVTEEKIQYQNFVCPGAYDVYHLLQNVSGGKSAADYDLGQVENSKSLEENSYIEDLQLDFEGFDVAALAQNENSIYLFYDRKSITYTFATGEKGTFTDGSCEKKVVGLYGAECNKPAGLASQTCSFVSWVDSQGNPVPQVFGLEDESFVVLWKDKVAVDDGFVEIDYAEGKFCISPTELKYADWYEVYVWALENGYQFLTVGKEGNTGTAGAVPSEGKNLPVAGISWNDAVIWCNAASEKAGLTPVYTIDGVPNKNHADSGKCIVLEDVDGYRLPTVAEWEYAAKGGQEFAYSGSDIPDEVAWYKDNSSAAKDVQLKAANGYGLYDMSGNVWEWCQDVDESNPGMRMMKGGSYFGSCDDSQIANGQSRNPGHQAASFGVRICRN